LEPTYRVPLSREIDERVDSVDEKLIKLQEYKLDDLMSPSAESKIQIRMRDFMSARNREESQL